ncbi:uncharacterized protein LOC124802834 [Schistocerca piceifrons]|uniref:uncharacterized protein LOC124802834 n=1 Tax=Schistocerca piceifrons TaxID=274613 RepID=UPI001F5EAD25|nr:uncharacterized protein LOC124802834 [Schistocerca piceifrons]
MTWKRRVFATVSGFGVPQVPVEIDVQHAEDFPEGSAGLRMAEAHIPAHAVRHESARLQCRFDLEGESLYSVKWYKDGREFYRYVPRDSPPALLFPVPGISVDRSRSNASQVTLHNVDLEASGRYRCEVSGEAPAFRTVSEHGDMLVVALPQEGPRISGGRPRYQVGDTVSLDCSSGPSRPAAHLVWYINDQQAERSQLVGPREVSRRDGLVTTVLGLRFVAAARHFREDGSLLLKCQASVAALYWRSEEHSVRPAVAMESRGAPAAGPGGAGGAATAQTPAAAATGRRAASTQRSAAHGTG